jgi:hypothetical protein
MKTINNYTIQRLFTLILLLASAVFPLNNALANSEKGIINLLFIGHD